MSLMSLIRWIGVIVIGWTLLAIGIGASGARLPRRELPVLVPSASPSFEAMPTTWPTVRDYELVDRADGRRTPIRFPEGDRWSNVSVAPGVGPGGELEAVGHWVNPAREEFSGWGVFRVSDGAVLSRIATEILPMGRPCWVPGQARTILFAAGDGRLYRCRIAPDEGEPAIRRPPVYASGRAEPSDPVVWEIAPPGSDEPMLVDPFWPAEARLRRWVFVTLMVLERHQGRNIYGPRRLWWLEMSDDARSIVAAGPLIEPVVGEPPTVRVEQRFPNVAVDPDGEIRLVYLEGRNRCKDWHLRSVPLEFDTRSGHPHAVTGEYGPVREPSRSLQLAPILVSSDGATAYGISQTGQIAAVALPRRANLAGATASMPRATARP
jgi:hypothetical protein